MSIEHPGRNIVNGSHFAINSQAQPKNTNEVYNQYGPYQRYRQMSLDDMLLENRIVFLIGEISYQRAAEVIMKMLYLDNLKRDSEISLYINSPGGSVDDTMAIYRLSGCHLLYRQSPVRRCDNPGGGNKG
jgi:ATP-dependent protease ClpP protease subunit